MLSEERKQEIYEQARKVNGVSKEYQLIHACFAIQKIIKEHINSSFQCKFEELRTVLLKEDLDSDEEGSMEEESNCFAEVVMELRRERNRKFYSNKNYERM